MKWVSSLPTITGIARVSGVAPPPELIAAASPATDPELMLHALREARDATRGTPRGEREYLEAVAVSEVYDVLVRRVAGGETVENAIATIRELRLRRAVTPPPEE